MYSDISKATKPVSNVSSFISVSI